MGVLRDGGFVMLLTLGQRSARIALARRGGVWLCSGLKLFHYQDGSELEAVAEVEPEPSGVEVVVTARHRGQKKRGNGNPPNMPANYHNWACGFSFVDGHAVTHLWRHASTLKKSLLSGGPWDSRNDFPWAQ